ncbi:hypothetical protein KUTeg_014300 [Tegillarca granosa]|uniref:Retinol dehydrogenase 14 n=1 Tax=Tegillarca granosa TaxID=220873 RepID=A0ABQ9EW68_TEGGR|nr:hypothetical protein KUTeg_014300 [Tegillarca granosa]
MASWFGTLLVAGGISVVILFMRRYFRRKKRLFISSRLMTGKTVIVTGANCGIGKATAQELARRGAKVIMACRDVDKANQAVKDIRKVTTEGILEVKKVDLLSQDSVRKFCEEIVAEEKAIHVLINNAAIMRPFMLTEDGHEVHMVVNHFSNFLLTNKIVFVSSSLHKYAKLNLENLKEKSSKPYANSKLANIYFAKELTERLRGTNVGVHTLHPGMVNTDLPRYLFPKIILLLLAPFMRMFLQSPLEGCQTVLYCAVSEELDGVSGKYYGYCKEEPWHEVTLNEDLGTKLWQISEEVTGLNRKSF